MGVCIFISERIIHEHRCLFCRSVNDFINSLSFEYLETYSFCRGEKYEYLAALAKDPLPYTEYLVGENGILSSSGEHTETFRRCDDEWRQIVEILNTEMVESVS